jgi:probable F420-dependent oxidoreductase
MSRGITVLRGGVSDIAATAARAEANGFDAAWSPEFYTRSGIVTLATMAATTSRVRIGSSIAYAVGRSPLTLATEARSLDEVSGGRLSLGIGTGTKRMMSDWHGESPEGPASRVEELVPLLRQLWRLHEGPVSHHGRFFDVEITPTAEVDEPIRTEIPVVTAGVNARMIETAGRVADGFLGHPLFTRKYLDEVVRPSIEKGATKTGRDASAVEICGVLITAVADDEEQARREVAAQLAFYCAPKTYATVLEVGGFGEAGEAIRAAFKDRDFEKMIAAVPAEMVDAMAVAGTPQQVRDKLDALDRSGVIDHVIVYPPSFQLSEERCAELVESLVTACAPGSGS